MVALLSIVLVTFLIVTGNDRAASFSYSQSAKADEVAQGGANLVIQYLRQEIMDTNRSELITNTSTPIPTITYMPMTNYAGNWYPANAYAVPERMSTSAIDPSLTNLVKISSATVPFYVGAAIPLAAPVNSGANSINGRYLTQARWNRPQLIDSGNVNKLLLPDWIIFTRSGTTNTWNNALKDQTSTNAAIGRVAFAVYDEGGLLDANSAGYPSSLTNSVSVRQKGLLPFADLSQIPSISNPNAFVQWRNPASASGANSYTNYVYNYGATNGFLKVALGDQALLSRQDLIQYAQANPSVIGTNALPYLTTFTREMNSPCYSPTTPTGSSINYASLAANTGATNPNFAVIQDNTHVPLKRFPLSRIALLANPSASAPGSASNIKTYFGLVPDSDGYSWDYNPDGTSGNTTIDILSSVPSSRPPNFFELLQAGIEGGSLGGTITQNVDSPFFGTSVFDANTTRQILTIGANIIDQYLSSGYPTVINIVDSTDPSGTPVVGVENMPMVSKMIATGYRPTAAEGNDAARSKLLTRLSFEVWNPHQNSATPPLTGPQNFRIVIHDGSVQVRAYDPYSGEPVYPPSNSGLWVNNSILSPKIDYGAAYTASPANTIYQIQFMNQPAFSEPTLLSQANSTNLDTTNGVVGPTSSAILLGLFSSTTSSALLDHRLTSSVAYEYHSLQVRGQSTSTFGPYSITVDLQFLDPSGTWRVCQRFPYGIVTRPTYTPSWSDFAYAYGEVPWVNPLGGSPWTGIWNPTYPLIAFARIDPRGMRWGLCDTYWNAGISQYGGSVGSTGTSVWPSSSTMYYGGEGGPGGPNFVPSSVGTLTATNRALVGLIGDNDTVSAYHYSDLDSVFRHADGNSPQGVLPMATGNTLDRPVMLNRLFQSVGELGYVYRDLPWKTIDFWSVGSAGIGGSADAGLLDLFTALDQTGASNNVVAGKINLNTRRPEVLAAMLSGTAVRELDTTQNMSQTSALAVANDLVSFTTQTPLLSKADLVSLFLASKMTQFDVNYLARKTEREAIVRALAEAGQTRTWNLLIDIVAQTGKYPPSATDLNQFNVEGERRYWLHVAIDRYTGRIIDSQLEPVYE